MKRTFSNISFIFFIFLLGCSNRVKVDVSSPEATLMTILEANHKKDAKAFLTCVTDDFLTAFGQTKGEAVEAFSAVLKKGTILTPSDYEILDKREQGDRVRIEFGIKEEFFDSFRYKLYVKLKKLYYARGQNAYLFVKTPTGWKAYGRDLKYANDKNWNYTEPDNRFKMLPPSALLPGSPSDMPGSSELPTLAPHQRS